MAFLTKKRHSHDLVSIMAFISGCTLRKLLKFPFNSSKLNYTSDNILSASEVPYSINHSELAIWLKLAEFYVIKPITNYP